MKNTLVDNPKEPFSLFREKNGAYEKTITAGGGDLWACGECGTLHRSWGKDDDTKKRAYDCCRQKYCDCGNKIEAGYSGPKCSPCNSQERYIKIITKAQEISEYDGPVYSDSLEKYWEDIGDFLDWASDQTDDDDSESIPEWIFPCIVKGFKRLNAMDLIESYLEDQHHEDAPDHINNEKEFQDFLDQWCAKQTLKSYSPDYSKKINTAKLIGARP